MHRMGSPQKRRRIDLQRVLEFVLERNHRTLELGRIDVGQIIRDGLVLYGKRVEAFLQDHQRVNRRDRVYHAGSSGQSPFRAEFKKDFSQMRLGCGKKNSWFGQPSATKN